MQRRAVRFSLAKFLLACVVMLSMLFHAKGIFASAETIPGVFPNTGAFQARHLKDQSNVAIIELSGNYDKNLPSSDFNIEPRTVVAKEFYRTHPDEYDFLVVFSNFEFQTGDASAFYHGVRNDVLGIGEPIFDNSRNYGAKRLQGYIDMAATSRYTTNSASPEYEKELMIFSHELMHRWGAYVKFKTAEGGVSSALLGREDAHWSYLLNSDASVMYGNRWRDNGDGTFTSVATRQAYSPLDLYLMGVLRKEEVPPFFLIDSPGVDANQLPEVGATVKGRRIDLNIDDVIAAEGARIPSAESAQKKFRFGFILLTRPGEEVSDAQIVSVRDLAAIFQTRLAILTGGHALVQSFLESKPAESVESNQTTPGSTGTVTVGADSAIVWLKNKEQVDGYWQDHEGTRLRDSMVALEALAEEEGRGSPAFILGSSWLAKQEIDNNDYLSRRILSVIGPQAGDVGKLLASQKSDGGWGVAPGYFSNPLDTAWALRALDFIGNEGNSASRSKAAAYLLSSQNPDGGWGNSIGGESHTASTAVVLRSLANNAAADAQVTLAASFLALRQNQDGGFGEGASSVHETVNTIDALTVSGRLSAIRAADAYQYVRNVQLSDGSWGGNIYSTALGLRALRSATTAFNWTLSDLAVGPLPVKDGQHAALSVRVRNVGIATSPATQLTFFDGDPLKGGVQIETGIAIPELAPGDSVVASGIWNTTGLAGNHEIFASVSSVLGQTETSTLDNQESLAVSVTPAPAGVDLEVNRQAITAVPAVITKLPSALTVAAQVSNLGLTDAGTVKVALMQGGATVLDERTVVLLARSSVPVTFSATLSTSNVRDISVVVDPEGLTPDPDRTNNSASVSVASERTLDLSVSADGVSVPNGISNLGADLKLKAKISNLGTADSEQFQLVYRLSDGSSSREIARRALQVAAGQTVENSVDWRADMVGDLQLSVDVDPEAVLADNDRSNNSATKSFKVLATIGSNLSLSYYDVNLSRSPALEGQDLTISAKVRNTGDQPIVGADVAFYEGDPDAGGVEIAPRATISQVAPGAQETVQSTIPLVKGSADRLYFVVVDPDGKITETSKADNRAFTATSVLRMADLSVVATGITTTPSAPKPGDSVAIKVAIDNLGQQPAPPFIVRLYHGSLTDAGSAVGDFIVNGIDGQNTTTASFTVSATTGESIQGYTVEVDPLNAVADSSRDNNTATFAIGIQSGNAYVSDTYFSPNRDGIKDVTSFSYRVAGGAIQQVRVVDSLGNVLKVFSDNEVAGATAEGVVAWDGKDTFGRIADDGVYRFQALDTKAVIVAEKTVTLDNNRQSILKAMGSGREYYRNITNNLSSHYVGGLVAGKISPDEGSAYFIDYTPEANLVRLNISGGIPNTILSFSRQSSLGIKVATVTSVAKIGGIDRLSLDVYNSNYNGEAWVLDGDGNNIRQVAAGSPDSIKGGSYFGQIGASFLSGDGNSLLIFGNSSDSYVRRVSVDDPNQSALLFDGHTGEFNTIELRGVAPSRRKALVFLRRSDNSGVTAIIDLETGTITRLSKDGTPLDIEFNTVAWAADSRRFALVSGSSFLLLRVFGDDGSQLLEVEDPAIEFQGNGDYGPVISNVDWASSGNEFVYQVRNGSGDATPEPVVRRLDVATGALTTLGRGRDVNAYLNNVAWLPYHRDVIGSEQYFLNEGSTEPLSATFNAYSPEVIGFLPSGRKLIFVGTAQPSAYTDVGACNSDGGTPQTTCDLHSFESLDNLTVDLRAYRSSQRSGIVVQGTATDENFLRYTLQYSLADSPAEWHAVAPASSTPVIDKELAVWAPPAYGSYLVRLTAEDMAGNQSSAYQRVQWSDTPSLSDVYKTQDYISPNGDGVQDVLGIHYRVLEPIQFEIEVFDQNNRRVRAISREHAEVGQEFTYEWDGRGDDGKVVPDGAYRLRMLDYEFSVVVDSTAPDVYLDRNSIFGGTGNPGDAIASPEVKFSFSEKNVADFALESESQLVPGVWETSAAGTAQDVLPPAPVWPNWARQVKEDGTLELSSKLPLSALDYMKKNYRLSVSDKAGNRVVIYSYGGGAPFVTHATGWATIQGQLKSGCSMMQTDKFSILPKDFDVSVPGSERQSGVPSSTDIINLIGFKEAGLDYSAVQLNYITGHVGQVRSVAVEQAELSEDAPYDWPLSTIIPSWHVDTFVPTDIEKADEGVIRFANRNPNTSDYMWASSSIRLVIFNADPGNRVPMATDPWVYSISFDDQGAVTLNVNTRTDIDGHRLVRLVVSYEDGTKIEAPVYRLKFGHERDRLKTGDSVGTCPSGDIDWYITPAGSQCNESPSPVATIALTETLKRSYSENNPNAAAFFFYQFLNVGNRVTVELASNRGQVLTHATVVKAGELFLPIDTANLPVGQQTLVLTVRGYALETQVNGTVVENYDAVLASFGASFVVDRSVPQINLNVKNSAKLCMSHVRQGDGRLINYLPIDGSVKSSFGAYWQIDLARSDSFGERTGNWSVADPIDVQTIGRYATPNGWQDSNVFAGFEPGIDSEKLRDECAIFGGEHCRLSGPYQWSNTLPGARPIQRVDDGMDTSMLQAKIVDRQTVRGEPASIDGYYNLRLRAYGPSGAQACTAPVNVELDGSVAADISTDRSIFSPNGDGNFDSAFLILNLAEPAQVRVEVFPATRAENGTLVIASGSPIRQLASDVQLGVGENRIEWDGKSSSGDWAADGLYAIRTVLTDGCGNERVDTQGVEIDTTPPAVSLETPVPASVLGLRTRVSGAVTDLHFKSYELSYASESDAAAGRWTMLKAGTGTVAPVQDLIVWNSDLAPGNYALRFVATDVVANVSTQIVPVVIASKSGLVASLDAVPALFSPNGDGRLETTRIGFDLLQSASVTIEILDAKGDVIARPQGAAQQGVGAHYVIWDGHLLTGAAAADGDYTVRLTANAVGDSGASQVETFGVRIDGTAPIVVVSSPLAAVIPGTQRIDATITDPLLASSQILLAAGDVGPWQPVIDLRDGEAGRVQFGLSDLAEGAYRFRVVATDQAQNVSDVSGSFEIDNTPPKLVLSTPANSAYLSGLAGATKVTGTVDEKNLARYRLLLSQGAPPQGIPQTLTEATVLPPKSGFEYSWDIKSLQDGPYRLALSADDMASHSSEQAVEVIVDNTSPVATFKRPDGTWYVRTGAKIYGTASDTNLLSYSLEISPGSLNSAPQWTEIARGANPVLADALLSTLDLTPGDGPAGLRLTVVDKAGNKTETVAEVVIDNAPPSAPQSLVATLENRRDAHLNWTPSQASDVAGYAVYRNGVRINELLVPGTGYVDAGLAEGGYQYRVRAVDQAGNESTSSPIAAVTVVLTQPVATIFNPARGGFIGGAVDITGTATSPSDFKEYRLSVGTGTTPTDWKVIRSSPVPMTAASLGSLNTLSMADGTVVSLRLEALDLSGQTATDTITATVDNRAPSAPLALQGALSGGDVALSWTAGIDTDVVGYLVTRDNKIVNAIGPVIGSLMPYVITNTNYLDQNLPDGKHHYYVQSIDKAGNLSDSSNSVEISVDRHPPHVVISTPVDGASVDKTAYVVGTTEDTDIASVQFQYRSADSSIWTNIGAAVTQQPWALTWSVTALPFGSYQLRAVGTDAGGLVDPAPAPIGIRITELERPAPTVLRGHAIGGNNQLEWDTSSASDLKGYVVEKLQDDDTWVSLNADPLSVPAYTDSNLADGTYRYRVTVVDKEGNLSTPSNELSLQVFTPQVEQPYTPTRGDSVVVSGVTRPNLHVVLEIGGVLAAEVDAAEDGSFVIPRPLQIGDGRFVLRARDAVGNVSKDVALHVLRALPPSVPTGLEANVAGYNVALAWAANPETNIYGYLVGIDQKWSTHPVSQQGATASSEFQPAYYGASFALDGLAYTGWMPSFDSPRGNDWIEVSLAKPELLDSVRVLWADYAVPQSFVLEGYDGEVWVPLEKLRNNKLDNVEIKLAQPYRTDRYRIRIDDTSDSVPVLNEISATALNINESTSAALTELSDGVHHFSVKAVNLLGLVGDAADVSPGVGDTKGPGAPVLGAVVQLSDVALSWTRPVDQDVAAYEIYRDGTLVTTISDPAVLAYTDGGRPNGSYDYYVVGIDSVGNVGLPSNHTVVSVAISAPTALLALSASASTSGSNVDLLWALQGGAIPTAYVVKRATQAGGPYETLGVVTERSFIDQGVTLGKTYFYVVAGLDQAGNAGAASNEVDVSVRDFEAPRPPVFIAPTVSGTPFVTTERGTELRGFAEPGSEVEITSNSASYPAVKASNESTVSSIGFEGDIQGYGVSADGKSALVGGYSWLEGVDLSTGRKYSVGGLQDVGAVKFSSTGGAAVAFGLKPNVGMPSLFVWKAGDATVNSLGDIQPSSRTSFAIAPSGKQVAVVGTDSTYARAIWMLDMESGLASAIERQSEEPISDAIAFSPDGGTLAFSIGQRLTLETIADKNVRSVELPGTPVSIDWSRQGSRIYVVVTDTAGETQVVAIDATTLLVAPLTGLEDGYTGITPAPDGTRYLLHKETGSVLAGPEDSAIPFAADVQADSGVQWADNGIAFYVSVNDTTSLLARTPAGLFVLPNTAVAAGDNTFGANARDAAGNRSLKANDILVRLLPETLPDLEVSTADIVSLPAAPIIGGTIKTAVRVWSRGANASASDVRVRVIGPDNVALFDKTFDLPVLAHDSMQSVVLEWQPSQAGRYRIVADVDTANALDELSETNNTTTRELTVSTAGLPSISVATDAIRYAQDAKLTAVARVTNAGQQFDGSVRIRIEDANGYGVTDYVETKVSSLAYGQEIDIPYTWAVGATVSGSYRVSANLIDASGVLAGTANSAFDIDADYVVTASTSSDKVSYEAGQVAQLRGIVNYVSGNAALATTAVVQLQLVDSNGAVVASRQDSLTGMRPGATAALDFPLNTAGIATGTYRLELLARDGNAQLAESHVDISITSAVAPTLSGVLSLALDALAPSDAIDVAYEVRNAGGEALLGLPITVRVIDSSTGIEYGRFDTAQDVTAGGSGQGTVSIQPTTTWPMKQLAVVLSVRTGSADRELDRKPLYIVDRIPPVVGFSSPVESAFLNANAGQVTITARDYQTRVESAEFSLDGVNWQKLALLDPSQGSYTISGVLPASDGPIEFLVRATDAAGNVSTVVRRTVVVDTTPPVIQVTGVVDGASYTADVTPIISVIETNPSTTVITLDGVLFASGTPVTTGKHDLHVVATDKAGNTSEKQVTFSVLIDTPSVAIASPQAGTWQKTPLSVGVQADSQVGLTTVELRVDAGAWQPMTLDTASGRWQVVLTGLSDGAHVLEARATTTAASTAVSPPVTVNIDNSAPDISVTAVSEGGQYRTSVAPRYEVRDVNLDVVAATVDGQPFESGSEISVSGPHTLVVTAQDKLGNRSTQSVGFAIYPIVLVGNLSSSSENPSQGETISIESIIGNQTGGAALALNSELSVRDADGKVVASFPEELSLQSQASAQRVRSWTVSGAPGSQYSLVLIATTEGQEYVLATKTINIGIPVVSIDSTATVVPPGRVLVYVSCVTTADDSPETCTARDPLTFGITPDPQCVAARSNDVDTLLNSQGIEHLVVTTEVEFQKQLRSGSFSTYWISGGATRLENATVSELRAAVFRGDTLMVDGLHDARNPGLDPILGIKYIGGFGDASVMMNTTSDIFASDEYPLLQRPVRLLPLVGAVSEASTTRNGVLGNESGIVANVFGLGRSLVFAFDLLGSLDGSDKGRMSQIVETAIRYLARSDAVTSVVAGGKLLHRVILDNRGISTAIRLEEKLPASATVIYVKPQGEITFDASGSVLVTWNATLASGNSIFDVVLAAPQLSGGYVANSTLNTIDATGQPAFYSSTVQSFSVVTTNDLVDSSVVKLQAIQASGGSAMFKAKAIQLLGNAKLSASAGQMVDALKYALAAYGYSMRIQDSDAPVAAAEVARVIEAIERRMSP